MYCNENLKTHIYNYLCLTLFIPDRRCVALVQPYQQNLFSQSKRNAFYDHAFLLRYLGSITAVTLVLL